MTDKERFQQEIFFPIGETNPYRQYFTGQSYLAHVSKEQAPCFNVTFEPGCRNNWHIHHAKSGPQDAARIEPENGGAAIILITCPEPQVLP